MPDQRVALVTGASRGIGRAIAGALGRNGLTVIGTATSKSGADAITEYLNSHGFAGIGLVLDVSNSASVDSAFKQISDGFGIVTVLVNNAGITRDNLLMRMKEDDWDNVVNTNLTSLYRVCKACLRGMTKDRYGRIVNIASVVGMSGNPGQTNYSAAKAGMIGFTKSLAREVGSRGITVNAVAPGFIDTDMTRDLADEQKTALLAGIPLGRLGKPDEIAETVAFLTSDSAAYITGETINVNGGMYMA